MNQLESNILALKQGGMISDIDLRPLPPIFVEDWNTIYQEWVSLKGILTNNVMQPTENTNLATANTLIPDQTLKTTIEN